MLKYTIPSSKNGKTFAKSTTASTAIDDDGQVSKLGAAVLEKYANAWLKGVRDLEAERAHPDLPFYSIRTEPDFARAWASTTKLVVKATSGK